METGLLHDFLGIFSMPGGKYYFRIIGSTQDEMNPCEVRLNIKTNIPAGGGGGMGQMGGGGGAGALSGIPSPYLGSHPR